MFANGIADRFRAFGIETAHSDTWNWEGLLSDMEESVQGVRDTGAPRFHQIDTYRLMAHSKGDDYRPSEEIAPFVERDPLNRIRAEHGDNDLLKEIKKIIPVRRRMAKK